tara:strand:- start:143 stop:553 length:411 start_codon:yes stop_codon:yes gene_type:complete
MSVENPHLLEKEIHVTFDWDDNTVNSFTSRIDSLLVPYPISQSQNFHMFTHIVQELNRKLNKFGLADKIANPIDAGFRPQNVNDFFVDYLKLEYGDFILQENGSRLITNTLNIFNSYVGAAGGYYINAAGDTYIQP